MLRGEGVNSEIRCWQCSIIWLAGLTMKSVRKQNFGKVGLALQVPFERKTDRLRVTCVSRVHLGLLTVKVVPLV